METTLSINDAILKKAQNHAEIEGRTLTSLVEDGLALVLSKTKADRGKRIVLPVSKATGGVFQGVDLNHSSGLEEVMNSP